jgi:hypothetical protein
MADAENFAELIPENTLADVEMGNEEVIVEIDISGTGANEDNNENGLPFLEEAMEDAPARITYIDYLKSPVIGLLVGQGDEQALLTAHQSLLTSSPWFADACAKFSDEVSVSISDDSLYKLASLT